MAEHVPIGRLQVLECAGCEQVFTWRTKSCRRPIWCSDKCRKRTLYSGTCVDCGGRTDGVASGKTPVERCRDCSNRRQGDRSRQVGIALLGELEALYAEGRPIAEIAQILEFTTGGLNAYIVRHRAKGANLPYRRNNSSAAIAAWRRGRKQAARLHAAA